MTNAWMETYLVQSAAAFSALCDAPHRVVMAEMAESITRALRDGGKLLLCGNGGSAGDAQHIAAEFVGRLMYDRAPLAAIALTTDTSALTAIANDYGFDQVFDRQVRALGRPGDVLIGLSTSGASPNVVAALQAGRAQGMVCLGWTGNREGPMPGLCDAVLAVPSNHTPIIQQLHITAGHVVCGLVERALFPPGG